MKTSIILIGMISLGFLNVNQAATAKQTSFNYQIEKEQFLVLVSNETGVKADPKSTGENYYFNPETVLPVSKKSLEQEIKEDNLIVENNATTEVSLDTPVVKSAGLTIYEDIQITEATGLDIYQPLDFESINNNPNCFVEFQNRCSLKQENIKL